MQVGPKNFQGGEVLFPGFGRPPKAPTRRNDHAAARPVVEALLEGQKLTYGFEL